MLVISIIYHCYHCSVLSLLDIELLVSRIYLIHFMFEHFHSEIKRNYIIMIKYHIIVKSTILLNALSQNPRGEIMACLTICLCFVHWNIHNEWTELRFILLDSFLIIILKKVLKKYFRKFLKYIIYIYSSIHMYCTCIKFSTTICLFHVI